MRNLIFILIMLLTLQIAYAQTEIFSGTLITDTDKIIDGSTFLFKYDENSKKAFVQTPATALIVDNGGCKSNDVFRICINMANFSHKNTTTYVSYYEIDANIYKLTGSLNTSSKAKLNSLLQGESTELEVTISNPTDFEITNIDFSYDLTPFLVIEANGCELNDRQMAWKGSLNPKYDKTCTATIASEKNGTFALAGNLSYFNGFETEKKITDSLAIKVLPKQLKVSLLVDKNIEVKTPFYLNISLENIHQTEDITALSTITLPSHVNLIKDNPAFEKNARVLKHGLALKPNASIYYSLYMEKISEGQEPINLRFAYSIKGINDVIESSVFVDVISTQPAKLPEPIAEEIKSNESINLTTTTDVQDFQAASENKTAEIKPENETTEQVTITSLQEPKKFSKNILIFGIALFAAFIIVVVAIFKTRKGKNKESDELGERIRAKLDEQIK